MPALSLKRSLLSATLGCLALFSCHKEAPQIVECHTAPEEILLTPAWQETTQRELSPNQAEALRRAVSARTALAAQLIGTLSETINTHGAEEAVRVCSILAPRFAADIGQKYGVAVGRTSIRTRNPLNLPPAWADEIVHENQARDVLLVGPDDRIATLTPIPTGALCTRCHGAVEDVDESVLAAIQRHYPLDQATGFELGELRGWFWVEAPIAEEPPTYLESQPNDLDELWMQLADEAPPAQDIPGETDGPERADSP